MPYESFFGCVAVSGSVMVISSLVLSYKRKGVSTAPYVAYAQHISYNDDYLPWVVTTETYSSILDLYEEVQAFVS